VCVCICTAAPVPPLPCGCEPGHAPSARSRSLRAFSTCGKRSGKQLCSGSQYIVNSKQCVCVCVCLISCLHLLPLLLCYHVCTGRNPGAIFIACLAVRPWARGPGFGPRWPSRGLGWTAAGPKSKPPFQNKNVHLNCGVSALYPFGHPLPFGGSR